MLIPLLSLSLFVTLSCGIPEESWLFLFSLCLWWRDVVTMECSGACQRRHSGWTEWSNVGMRRGEDYPEKGRGKIIWPCVHLQYFFIWLYSTDNMKFNKLQQQIYQTSCSPCQDNTTRDMSGNYIYRYISTWPTLLLKKLISVSITEANPSYVSHSHTLPPQYIHRIHTIISWSSQIRSEN